MPSFSQVLAQSVADSGVKATVVYATADNLPLTGNEAGDIALVNDTHRLYIFTGTGWYNVALINTNPAIITGPDGAYNLATDGTPTVITLEAQDPEGVPITWSYVVTSGVLGSTATVSQVNNEFTITPSTTETDAGEFSITFTASDGVNLATAASSFTLQFAGDWANAVLLHTLNNPNAYDTPAADLFGQFVAISGDYAFVAAAYEKDASGTASGKIYIFNVVTGALVKTLDNPNAYGTSQADLWPSIMRIDGSYLLAPTWREDDAGGTESGKAYIFQTMIGDWSDTILMLTIDNPNAYDTSLNDQFGIGADISGNYCAIGANNEENPAGVSNSGRVYIFNVSTGALINTLDNPNAYSTASSDLFGTTVTMHGNYIMAAATFEDSAAANDVGKIYIFKTTTGDWTDATLIKTIDAPTNAKQFVNFGRISISGDYMVASSTNANSYAGEAYIFKTTTGDWTDTTLLHTIVNPNTDPSTTADEFGDTVSASGNFVAISAFRESDASGTGSGKVYIFQIDTGALIRTIDNPNPYGTSLNDFFAPSAMSGNYLVVGARSEDQAGGTDSGKAYIFQAG
jgi:hypothetical protein